MAPRATNPACHCNENGDCMDSFHTVCQVHDLPPGKSRTVVVGNKLIALFHVDGRHFAIDDVCPHMGALLGCGCVENGIVACPWHAWRFRLADGVWADNPHVKIGCYPVRVEGEKVQIWIDQPSSSPQSKPSESRPLGSGESANAPLLNGRGSDHPSQEKLP